MPSKNVALVLSSGGARGFAYIGAIEELERRGYRISSVAGCSIGSLIGGLYAAGGLERFKDWLFAKNDLEILHLMDIHISLNSVVKGDRIIAAIKEVVPEVDIQDLRIPYTAVASDLYTGEEVVFRQGPMFDAIRASISVPTLFRPVKYGHRTLVDGGLVNTMPLNRVSRIEGDILVGFDVNDINAPAINAYLAESLSIERKRSTHLQESISTAVELRRDGSLSLMEKLQEVGGLGRDMLRLQKDCSAREKRLKARRDDDNIPVGADDSYFSIISRSFSVVNHVLAQRMIEACPPDILVRMPLDAIRYNLAYARGREISEMGRSLMAQALDEYENKVK